MGKSIQILVCVCLGAVFAFGCDDEAGVEGGTGNGGFGDFSFGRDAGLLDQSILPTGDAGNEGQGGNAGSGAGGTGGMAGSGGAAGGGGECEPFDRRCPESGGAYVEVCTAEGRWVSEACGANELCLNADCIPDPVGCEPGTSMQECVRK